MTDITSLSFSDEDIAALRKTQLRLLDAVDAICKKHGLTYWIDFGTLLGAVRHKYFIPWDDDIDISMPIPDYKKFLKIAETELPHDIFLQTPKTDPAYKQYMTKLRDCHSTYMEHHESENTPYHMGIFLDIFPAYDYPNLPKKFRKIMTYFTGHMYYDAYVKRKNRLITYPLYWIFKLFWILMLPFKSGRFGQCPEDNNYNYAVPSKFIFPIRNIEFAGKMYPAPNNPHEVLSRMYGPSYMTPPPNKHRVPHAKAILPHTPCRHPRAINKENA